MRILIVGGYGVFGARLARLLADEPGLTLLIAGRSSEKAGAFCDRWRARARMEPVRFDRDSDAAAQLAALAPDLVVDCSGPFQAYGAAPFRMIEACIAQGRNYLDLADGSDFVLGVQAFDAASKAAGVFAISGTSTCPALTSAAVAGLTEGWRQVSDISAGIAPSPHARVGKAVIQALASYAGHRVRLWRGGAERQGRALLETRNITIAPPGRLPLFSTRFSLVDVPDLTLMARLWPEVRDVWVGAGPRPELLHRMFNGLALLRAWGLPVPLVGLSGLIHAAKTRLSWGEDRGGMFVRVHGLNGEGRPATRVWTLTAEGDDGPFVPAMAAAALIKAILAGRSPARGARPAAGAVSLGDYAPLFAARRIVTAVRDEEPADPPVYRQTLANAWADLPPAVRALHDLPEGGKAAFEGLVDVVRGRGPLAWLAARIVGFPRAQLDGPIRVEFERRDGVELWTRICGDERFSSRQSAGRGRAAALAVETFGPMACGMAPVLEDGRLRLIPRRWTLFGVALPAWLFPRIEAWEAEEDGRFRFHVDLSHPLTGPIVLYRGWLVPAGSGHPVQA